ncbi:flagellar basal-body MS-ring/collar protein FliF [Hyphomonas johnsonii]|uniref:Flagellar M-ring protein n=1 Tax=Hyphomonas johnsonii MHS-2 TaxID=1280950 RepID=A0A059FNI5_9PROT|nr:flagellar basal-body MS-ring/collar protein FliF [Hyphomonas johnsonii]KCZ92209.1 flagellar MS-ring protein [Hyphomonas johnsonii MHS-2]
MSFIGTLKALPLPRQLMLAGAVLGVVLVMTFMVRGVVQQPMALLYSGLEPASTGEVIEELDKRGTRYEIRGDAIFIPANERDGVRFALASSGLPQQSVQGYELLDEVNGFSVTSEMYNAAYWRAKEGELTRTILAIPGIKSVRVHIGASLRSGFARSDPKQTASVSLSTTRDLTGNQAEAIQYLVALAVSGLSPDEVAVIDSTKGILAGPGVESANQAGSTAETQEGALEQKIRRLLEARVGPGNSRVSVTMDVSHERLRTTAVSYDPDSRVVRNRSSGDVSESSGGSTAGITAASNLPQTAGEANGQSTTSTTRNSSETVSYEINEVRTESERMPGAVERISVAVLLNDQVLGIDPAAADAGALTEQMAEDFKQLIASAAGLDTSRGDDLTVEFMPFQIAVAGDMVEAPGVIAQLLERYLWSGVKVIVLGIVVIVLAFGVIRPLLNQKPEVQSATGADGQQYAVGADPFLSLKDFTMDRQDDAAAILQEWLNEDRKAAVNE